ncbi:cytochrome P450 704C1-like isoform X1 [Vicia villosa]|uniref:cytochrome P450 704C1-like isoform X1 n=2 Tax=Vicia villosa TaxID=3911 RepID=UPI00273B0A9A|nr:cytochrome P450 704C1-like isoform X1 [Vicia villosa]
MNMLFLIMFYFLSILFLFLFLLISILILTTFIGQSIGNPKFPPVKGTVFHQLINFKTLFHYLTQIALTNPTFRLLAPKKSKIYTCETRNIEHILKTNFHNYSKGKFNHDTIFDLFGDGIFAVDDDKWRHQRKLASVEFSTRVLRDCSCNVFKRNAAKLVRVVLGFSNAGMVFDIQDIVMKCTLDSIFKVGFGVELQSLERSNKEENVFMKAFNDSNAFVFRRYLDPLWKLKRVLNFGSEASLKKNIKIIDDFVHSLIKTKRKLLSAQNDFSDKEDILSRFLLESEKDPSNMTDQYLRDIILNFMIAGKDTSANTLSWFFYMLCKNPLIQEKVAQEVINVTSTQENKLDLDEFVNNITDDNLDKMHYLHAALTETLRLYPAVPMTGRTAEENDLLPDGYMVNKGETVYYLSYAMGRMPYIWGDDAEEFLPERWLKDGIFQPESSFKFISFHAGPRICLGKDFAYRQMKIVAMALVRFFRFKLANERNDVTYRTMFTLHIDKGLPLYAVPRCDVFE